MVGDVLLLVETTRHEVSAPPDGAVVSHLDDPAAGRALRAVKDCALPLQEEKQVLDQIIGFGVVSKNPGADATNDASIPLEESRQSALFPSLKALINASSDNDS